MDNNIIDKRKLYKIILLSRQSSHKKGIWFKKIVLHDGLTLPEALEISKKQYGKKDNDKDTYWYVKGIATSEGIGYAIIGYKN